MNMKKNEKLTKAIYTAVSVLILVVFLFPIYWMFITSFKSDAEVFANPPTFYPHKLDFSGYLTQMLVSGGTPLWKNFLNSFLIAGITTLISSGLAIFSAYGLARFRFRCNKYILFGVLVTQMLPTVMFLAPLFIIFNKIGITDSLISPMVFVCIHSIPFSIITLRPYYMNVPLELEDAAIIDGCSQFMTFIRIIIPISYPGIIVASVFTFLWGWGDLMGPLTFIKTENLYPLTVNMYKAIGEYGIDWNSLMAFAVMLTIPVLVLFISLQRYLISGITSGAVKG